MIQETESLQVHLAYRPGDIQAPPEVPVGLLPQLPVGAHHAQVVMGDGAALLVSRKLEAFE